METLPLNVFNQIHKALRILLFDTASAMQRTDMGDAQVASGVIEQVTLVLELFDTHAHHEDLFILEDVKQRNNAIASSFEAEHVEDLRLSGQLRNMVDIYLGSSTNEERLIAGRNLYYALNDFIAFNLYHMNKEERELNEFLWANYSTEEILAMEIKIQQAIPQEKLFTYFIWMIKGINDRELEGWLGAVKAGAPDFIYTALLGECNTHLEATRWKNLSGRLGLN